MKRLHTELAETWVIIEDAGKYSLTAVLGFLIRVKVILASLFESNYNIYFTVKDNITNQR